MNRTRLHGTDGIRGRVQSYSGDDEGALRALVEDRTLSNRAMRIIGEATGLFLNEKIGDSPLVLIGWDRRDGNAELVDALQSGLGASGCRTMRIGEVPTPGIHHAVLACSADAGMMVTASHNPATDSGVKLFDAEGYKSMPNDEDKISQLAWDLVDGSLAAPQESEEVLDEIDGLSLYRNAVQSRISELESLFNLQFDAIDWGGSIASPGLLLDCSGGAGATWLADQLTENGLVAIEVSSRLDPINENCGAGDFSPTQEWVASELLIEPPTHRLLWCIAQRLENNGGVIPWEPGEIIAAALDGDGDRCLLIEGTLDGLKIVDGDRMCDDILRASIAMNKAEWKMASSIESDLGLTADLKRLGPHQAITTAVGDRWLSAALWPDSDQRIIVSNEIPRVIGTEDSGHLVMPTKIPHEVNRWGMVGDGTATLIASLMAKIVTNRSDVATGFSGGWKKRVSIKPSIRERWDGRNQLAEMVQRIVEEWGGSPLQRIDVKGEPALLLLSGQLDDLPISIAVRNSGTEAKTAISIRFAKGVVADGNVLMERLVEQLSNHLMP
ncbi:MAG: hypothetical protein VYA86_07420 [Candidatus Thermoplasmatota archaeon]|nr:hypothetical protein [Candidatus Thermoplasmatota archaeon]